MEKLIPFTTRWKLLERDFQPPVLLAVMFRPQHDKRDPNQWPHVQPRVSTVQALSASNTSCHEWTRTADEGRRLLQTITRAHGKENGLGMIHWLGPVLGDRFFQCWHWEDMCFAYEGAKPSQTLDINCVPMGPDILSSIGAGVFQTPTLYWIFL